MPHLSPMNWLLAMMISWYFILLSSASKWWSLPNKFIPLTAEKKSASFKNWSWL